MSKWTRAVELGKRGIEQARAAGAQIQATRDAAEAAKAREAAARPERYARERAARIADATGPDGLIRGAQATWDGRVLRVGGGNVVLQGGRKRRVYLAVTVPASRIASASAAFGLIHVCVMDGREYRFMAPLAMAEAIETAITQ